MQENFNIRSIKELRQVAEALLAFCDDKRVITFKGEIGAGKTTLITIICELLQVEDKVSSPTFSIVNEYQSPKGDVFHIDLYRLGDMDEAIGIGIEDYIDSGNYCFVEWAEIIYDLIDMNEAVQVKIEVKEDGVREISFLKNP